jgi:hypothetical protein
MVLIPGMVRYLDINMSSAPPINGAVPAAEIAGAIDAAASGSLVSEGRGAP